MIIIIENLIKDLDILVYIAKKEVAENKWLELESSAQKIKNILVYAMSKNYK